MNFISWVLVIFGFLLTTSLFTVSIDSRDDYFYTFSIALSFVILGVLGLEYKRKQYMGGIPSIIGVILGLLGIQFLVLAVEQYFHAVDDELIRGGFTAFIVFLIPAIMLLRYGHKVHQQHIKGDQ